MKNSGFIRRGWPWRIYAILLAAIGLVLTGMGAQLVAVGGSPYYVAAGLLTLLAGILIWRGDSRGALVYVIMLAGTFVWAFAEAGADAWPLVARLVAPTVLAFPLAAAWLRRKGGIRLLAGVTAILAISIVALGILLSTWEVSGEQPAAPGGVAAADTNGGDWTSYGRTASGTRFAPFQQISTANVKGLEEVWRYRAGARIGEATPLKIGSSLYLCTADNQMIALDAATGAQRWRYDPQLSPHSIGRACRGVAYHAQAGENGECAASVYVQTRDARLIAVDAANGRPCSRFGRGGVVDLKEDVGEDPHQYQYATSPPIVVGDIVIVGNCVYDGQQTGEVSGVVRAFNARTGALIWAWDMGRPGVNTPPKPGETYTLGTANVWSLMSADPELGLVYLPTGNATPDYYGGHRTNPLLEKYGSSIVALDVKSGAVRWAFKTVHHDIWDYDVASQPVLFDFPTARGKVPAVLQATKRGELFVLDRRTGVPLTKVEERPVPQGAVPGDYTSPTQPFSVGMPSLLDPPLRESDMWGVTPVDQLWCRLQFRKARYEGTMTPTSTRASVRWPGSSGIYNWGSISIDESTGVMVTATLHLANYDRLIPQNDPESRRYNKVDSIGQAEIGAGAGGPQRGTPYTVSNPPFFSPLAVPCTKPPYGRVSAIDLKTRKLLWSRPVGTTRNSGPFGTSVGLVLPMGVPVNGGFLVTRGGLSFFAGSQDGYMRAYDTRTGAELWRQLLPAASEATPMSYLSPANGRQMIVVTAGGPVGAAIVRKTDDYVVAYALPTRAK